MGKWFDANGVDVDAYPERAFRGGVYEGGIIGKKEYTYLSNRVRNKEGEGEARVISRSNPTGDSEISKFFKPNSDKHD